MKFRKILMMRLVLLSLFIPSCGSWLVPAVRAVHSARMKKKAEVHAKAQEPGTDAASAMDRTVSMTADDAAPGTVEAEMVPAVSRETEASEAKLETYSELPKPAEPAHDAPALSGIRSSGEEILEICSSEAEIIEESSQDDLVTVSAPIEKKGAMLLEEPSGLKETPIKALSPEEVAIKKLLEKVDIKNMKKLSVFHPPGQLEDLVLLWNPITREAVVLDAIDEENKIYPAAVAGMKHFLRDRKSGDEIEIHPKLVHLLYEMAAAFDHVLYITSGYRKPGGGTRTTSYHTKGMAADLFHPWVKSSKLREFAIAWGAGGVGLYPKSGSVHVDVREKPYYWIGKPTKRK